MSTASSHAFRTRTNAITQEILKFLFSKGIFAWRQNVVAPFDPKLGQHRASSKKGVSDILAVVPPNGKFLAIEIKVGKDRMRPEQVGFMESIHFVGGCHMVVHNFEDFKDQFKFSDLL